jgi:REP element-mobilizing transposase RayT
MPRKSFIPSSEFPYHVTGRCLNKEWFRVSMDYVWSVFSDYLFFINRAFNIQIHCFILMNNHFHLIAATPEANLDEAMNYFMREVSRRISKKSGRINQVFGGPYHWSLLQAPNSFQFAYKYVYRNPIEAGLCVRVEDYKYSTLQVLLGQQHSVIPLQPDEYLFSDFEGQLRWLNESYPSEKVKDEIRKALRRYEFCFAKRRD